jgi:hypothetical protein
MKTIHIYDPALCCSTGVCGPTVDPKLVRFAADLAWLAARGVRVERFNLAQSPLAFAQQPCVVEALRTQGDAALPLVLVDGVIATRAIYPTREQLAQLAGVPSQADEPCCGGDTTSCCGEPAKEWDGHGANHCC